MMFGNWKGNALEISATKIVLSALFARMVPTPLGWVFVSCFFLDFFHVTSISVFISYLFTFKCIMANVQFFVVVNNVLGFAKKENKQKKHL